MSAKRLDIIAKNVERFAAASLAAAIGYAVFTISALPQPEGGMCAAVAAVITFTLCRSWFAARAEKDQAFAVPVFDVREIEMLDVDELLLTDLDRVGSVELVLTDDDRIAADELLLTEADRAPAEPLELDDILAELGPDSRVVRLFDRKAMPTPGQLKDRIDNHLDQARPEPVQSDAAQALSDALAELRRSLRR